MALGQVNRPKNDPYIIVVVTSVSECIKKQRYFCCCCCYQLSITVEFPWPWVK
jgi:hypothetical protein